MGIFLSFVFLLADVEKLNSDPVLCGKTAEVVCQSAVKVIPDVDFKFSLLEICTKYKFAKGLQKKIYKYGILECSRI